MKKEVSPGTIALIVIVVLAAIVAVGWKYFAPSESGPSHDINAKNHNDMINQIHKGGPGVKATP